MNKTIKIGAPPIDICLRRSSRARRYSLRVSNSDGQVSLTMPNNASERAAVSFALRQEGWLRNALGKLPELVTPEFGGTLLLEGVEVQVVPGSGRRAELTGQALSIPGKPEELPARLRGFLKVTARARLASASNHYAGQLGKKVTRLTLRDTRSRWGSCTEAGNLMFSWRLILAPPEVLKYVAAHEVAHMKEMNHSPDFWRVVGDLMPGFEPHRRWLKKNGATLHRYQL